MGTQLISFHRAVLEALLECDPAKKTALVMKLETSVPGVCSEVPLMAVNMPGRPAKPVLVAPTALVQRKISSEEGRIALLHAIAHIEFNAINLALDAVHRFRDMPKEYVADWLKIAREEALHFTLLREHLQSFGCDYGDFPAHDGLWSMAVKTANDVLVRMALVPRILEARGLDVTPSIRGKFAGVGDRRACEILDIILRDEIGHVRIGNRWFHWCCQQRGLVPVATFVRLLREYEVPTFRGELNYPARLEAGFSADELELIESLNC